MAFLTVRVKGTEGYTRIVLGKDRNLIGRASACEVPVKHSSISREHCAIFREAGEWFVEDLGSSNGTWINHERIPARRKLVERDRIKCGSGRFTFHSGELRQTEGGKDEDGGLDLNLDGDESPSGPLVKRGENDPPESVRCAGCECWLSIAHRVAGEGMACPRCGHQGTVPSLQEA